MRRRDHRSMSRLLAPLLLLAAGCSESSGVGDGGAGGDLGDGGASDTSAGDGDGAAPEPAPEDTTEPDPGPEPAGDAGDSIDPGPGPDTESDLGPGPETDAPDADTPGDVPEEDTGTAKFQAFLAEETGFPQDFVLKGIWAGHPTLAVVAGNDGVIGARDAEGTWSVLNEGHGSDLLNAVAGTGPDNVWAAGIGGTLLHGTATEFLIGGACPPGSPCDVQIAGTFPTLWGAYAAAPDDAWVVGLGAFMGHWDGVSWSQFKPPTPPSATWYGVYTDGVGLVLAGSSGKIAVKGDDGLEVVPIVEADAGGILQPITITTALRAVHSADGAVVWVVGAGGNVIKGEAEVWQRVLSPTKAALYTVFMRSPTEGYAAGDGGTILYFDGATWNLVAGDLVPPDVAAVNFRGLWVDEAGVLTLTGAGGAVVEGSLAAGFQHKGQLYPEGLLDGAWGSGTFRTLVGDDGQIFVYTQVETEDGAIEWKWIPHQNALPDDGSEPEFPDLVPSEEDLRAVWASSPTDAWAVGLMGRILRWNGSTWSKSVSFTDQPLEAVYGNAPDNVYAVGAQGTILRWNGTFWNPVALSTKSNFRDVISFPTGEIWAVGANGAIFGKGELGWGQVLVAPQITPPPAEDPTADPAVQFFEEDLFGIWGAAPDDLWAVGDKGVVVHWDGTGWTQDTQVNFGITLRSIWGRAADDLWAVGLEGHVIHYDGATWDAWPTGSVATLYAIDGDGQGTVRISGDLGTVLELYEGDEPPPE